MYFKAHLALIVVAITMLVACTSDEQTIKSNTLSFFKYAESSDIKGVTPLVRQEDKQLIEDYLKENNTDKNKSTYSIGEISISDDKATARVKVSMPIQMTMNGIESSSFIDVEFDTYHVKENERWVMDAAESMKHVTLYSMKALTEALSKEWDIHNSNLPNPFKLQIKQLESLEKLGTGQLDLDQITNLFKPAAQSSSTEE